MATAALPTLLSKTATLAAESSRAPEWVPKNYLAPPQPPPPDETKLHEIEMAHARQAVDGKALKKIRPRRTVDYGGSMGRWALVSSFQSSQLTNAAVILNSRCRCASYVPIQHMYHIFDQLCRISSTCAGAIILAACKPFSYFSATAAST